MKKHILLLFAILFCSCYSSKEDKSCGLKSYSFLSVENGWVTSPSPSIFFNIQSDPTSYFMNSALYITNGQFTMRTFPLIFNINNSFYIPEKLSGKEIKLSVNNKCLGLEKAIIRMSLFNKEEQLTDTLIMDINTLNWESKKMAFIPDKNVIFFNVEIEAIGQASSDSTGLWLGNMYAITEGLELKNLTKRQNNLKDKSLNRQSIISIPGISLNAYQDLSPVLNKRVLALGETLHGSVILANIAFEITKDQIKNNNCRLVMMELSIDEALYLNLYIQGKLPDSSINDLRERTKFLLSTFPIEECIDFYQWLREYNKTALDKVTFLGFDIIKPFMMRGVVPLREYVMAYLDNDTRDLLTPLIELMYGEVVFSDKITEYLNSHSSSLSDLFGEEDFTLFKFCWEEQLKVEKALSPGGNAQYIYNQALQRDYHMWLNTKMILNTYNNDSAKIVVMGHSAHLNKSMTLDQTAYNRSFGYYLAEYFKENYQAIALTAGQGERIVTGHEGFYTYNDTLPTAIDNSFEKIAQEIDIPHFFYPSSELDDDIVYIRDMPLEAGKSNFIQSEILSKRLDGIIFINKSFSSPERFEMSIMSKDRLFEDFSRYLHKQIEIRDSLLMKYGVDLGRH